MNYEFPTECCYIINLYVFLYIQKKIFPCNLILIVRFLFYWDFIYKLTSFTRLRGSFEQSWLQLGSMKTVSAFD